MDHSVTLDTCDDSPRLEWQGFSGLLLMAPSEPRNRVATTPGGDEAFRDLTYWLAQQTVGTLLLLPTGTIYRGKHEHYRIFRVQTDCTDSIAKMRGDTKLMVLSYDTIDNPTHRAAKMIRFN